MHDNVIVQGDGIFDTRSVHSFDVQPSDIIALSPLGLGGSSNQGDNDDDGNSNSGGDGNSDSDTLIDSTDDPISSVSPHSCPEQANSVPVPVPLLCFADMGRAATGDHIVFNESPLVDLGCFPMRGNGTGLSVDSVEGSAFGFISEHVRSVVLSGNKDTQLLEVKDASTLSPGTSDFSVMLWVKLAPNSSPGGDIWIAHHGNSFRTVPGWAIRASGQSVSFRVNDGKAFGRRILRNIHDGNWHHLAMVVDRSGSGIMHAYIDGSEQLDITLPGAGSFQDDKATVGANVNIDPAAPLTLGIRLKEDGVTRDRAMKGALDGFALYRAVLSRDIVKATFEGRGTNGENVASSVCPMAVGSQVIPPQTAQDTGGSHGHNHGNSQHGHDTGSSDDAHSPQPAPQLDPQPAQQPTPSTPSTPLPTSGDLNGSSLDTDPCRCSGDGFSGTVFTNVIGCNIKTFFADLCYVQEPTECVESFPSTNFEGAAYRRCDDDV